MITVKLSPEELKLLVSLASDQLFRREFIDPKMPGYKSNAVELGETKALMGRLRLLVTPNPPGGALLPRLKVTAVKSGGAAV